MQIEHGSVGYITPNSCIYPHHILDRLGPIANSNPRINELCSFEDNTLEITKEELQVVVVKGFEKLNGKGLLPN